MLLYSCHHCASAGQNTKTGGGWGGGIKEKALQDVMLFGVPKLLVPLVSGFSEEVVLWNQQAPLRRDGGIRRRQGSGAVTWEMTTQLRALNPTWWSRIHQLVIKGNRELFLRGGLVPRVLLCFLSGLCKSGRNSSACTVCSIFLQIVHCFGSFLPCKNQTFTPRKIVLLN